MHNVSLQGWPDQSQSSWSWLLFGPIKPISLLAANLQIKVVEHLGRDRVLAFESEKQSRPAFVGEWF